MEIGSFNRGNAVNRYYAQYVNEKKTDVQQQEISVVRSRRVKRGTSNGIQTSDPWYVRLSLGGILEFIPGVRDINPIGAVRRIFGGRTAPGVPTPRATTTTVPAPARPPLPGFRPITFQGQSAYIRPSGQADIFELYHLGRYQQPLRTGLVYLDNRGQWRSVGLSGGGDPVPGPSGQQPPVGGIWHLLRQANQMLQSASDHATALSNATNLFIDRLRETLQTRNHEQMARESDQLAAYRRQYRILNQSLAETRNVINTLRVCLQTWNDRHPEARVAPRVITNYLRQAAEMVDSINELTHQVALREQALAMDERQINLILNDNKENETR